MKIHRAIGFIILLITLKLLTGDIFDAFSKASTESFRLVEATAIVSQENILKIVTE